MSLTGQQIERLATAIEDQLDSNTLTLIAARLERKPVENGTLKYRAYELILRLSQEAPIPRDREFLKALLQIGNEPLRRLATELLSPGFFPQGDPHKAVMLGPAPFLGRDDLREAIRDFSSVTPDLSTHVLVVSGREPGGKSYTYKFLHLLAREAGAEPISLNLRGRSYSPREFISQAMTLLSLGGRDTLPELTDQPQYARTSPLLNAFKGSLAELRRPYWLMVDEINDPSITLAVRETAYAMAYVVEELKPRNLWLALLGYNDDITPDAVLGFIARDDAEFPSREVVADFFKSVADANGVVLEAERATQMASLMFEKFSKLDKESMSLLSLMIARAAEKLRKGIAP